MSRASWVRRTMQLSLGAAIFLCLGPAPAAEPDPAVLTYKLPDQIKWVENGRGGAQAVLVGDPAKPGLYVVLTKWYAGNMSRPHSHPTVRYITVLSGTWWLGWGDKYDPDSTYPVKAGSFVTHFANQIHYDGAKGEDAVLQIVGIGPAESAPANRKQ